MVMALIKCPTCSHDISPQATTCPSCGGPLTVKPQGYKLGRGGSILALIGVVFLIGIFHEDSPKTPSKPEISDADCKKDLQCWGDRHSSAASVRCDSMIEKLAKFSFEWTDRWYERKFSKFGWENMDKGTLRFLGDKIKFQNGFGAWQIMTYECVFDPTTKIVLNVRAYPGQVL
jgi:hypothetical protein